MQNKWLLVLGLVGVFLLLVGPMLGQKVNLHKNSKAVSTLAKNTGNLTNSPNQTASSQSSYDKQLKSMLENIQGINKVSVMVTLDSTGSVKVANDTRTSTQTQHSGNSGQVSNSTTTDTQVFTQTNQSGDKVPYVVQRTTAKVRGVLVTVNAKDFYVAKSEIINAITNVLDVPAYKISVEPQKASS
jgi:stage III sporulation protein AG